MFHEDVNTFYMFFRGIHSVLLIYLSSVTVMDIILTQDI